MSTQSMAGISKEAIIWYFLHDYEEVLRLQQLKRMFAT